MPQIIRQIDHQGIQGIIDSVQDSPLNFYRRIENI
jgi:hypothetical protein